MKRNENNNENQRIAFCNNVFGWMFSSSEEMNETKKICFEMFEEAKDNEKNTTK